MHTITIMDRDESGALSVTLADILDALGDTATHSTWRVRSVEATGPGASALDSASNDKLTLSSKELATLAHEIWQVIDGEFAAYSDAGKPWLIARAVDSSSWDISADDQTILDRFRQKFRTVHEVGDVGY